MFRFDDDEITDFETLSFLRCERLEGFERAKPVNIKLDSDTPRPKDASDEETKEFYAWAEAENEIHIIFLSEQSYPQLLKRYTPYQLGRLAISRVMNENWKMTEKNIRCALSNMEMQMSYV